MYNISRCKLSDYIINSLTITSKMSSMDKPTWKKIDQNTSKPSSRWGHTCCVIGQQIVFFGGYADSNYMHDLWTYNSTTMKWHEVHTTGDKPAQRSNCSMNYDPVNNNIVIFGGGGPNKQRFNAVNVLDWNTKNWIEILPKENQPGPWERTYHTAQLKFPYLVVFGGEGIGDLEDLWIFSFLSLRWTEAKFEKDSVRPCARRFHSSCLVGNEMYIIAGCYAKYRCLTDIYSLDLTPLLESGSTKGLTWIERKPKDISYITRWGHSSAAYDNKIYIFAGRFSNDLNDIWVFDPKANTLKSLKMGSTSNDAPKARRRHCAGFVGSCMIIFGGFNGEYFNDLHYINVFELSNKIDSSLSLEQLYKDYVNSSTLSDKTIFTKNGQKMHTHSGLLSRYFKNGKDLERYLEDINRRYEMETLTNLMSCLYRGYGNFETDVIHKKHGISFTETYNRKMFISDSLPEQEYKGRNALKMASSPAQKTVEPVVSLPQKQFQNFIHARRNHWSTDCTLKIQEKIKIRANRSLLALGSTFFQHAFSGHFTQKSALDFSHNKWSPLAFDILVNYLMVGVVVMPDNFSIRQWMKLSELSEYFCLSHLRNICESQLCARVDSENVVALQSFSLQLQLDNLALHCANHELKKSLQIKDMKTKFETLKQPNPRNHRKSCTISSVCLKLYETVKFDLVHNEMLESKQKMFKKKSESETSLDEKENNSRGMNKAGG